METKEKLLDKLKELQAEYITVSRLKFNLSNNIKNITKKIDRFDDIIETERYRVNKLINRDVELVADLVKEKGPVSSKQIVLYLNEKLEDKPLRWKNKLDSNIFMTSVGRILENKGFNKEPGHYENRKTYFWSI